MVNLSVNIPFVPWILWESGCWPDLCVYFCWGSEVIVFSAAISACEKGPNLQGALCVWRLNVALLDREEEPRVHPVTEIFIQQSFSLPAKQDKLETCWGLPYLLGKIRFKCL